VLDLGAALQHVASEFGQQSLPDLLAEVTRCAERYFVQTALRQSDFDEAKAARLLGMTSEGLDLLQQRLAHKRESKGSDEGGSNSPPRAQ
jgi:transcriptional regulator with GAF, ATPase, and Fis domain